MGVPFRLTECIVGTAQYLFGRRELITTDHDPDTGADHEFRFLEVHGFGNE